MNIKLVNATLNAETKFVKITKNVMMATQNLKMAALLCVKLSQDLFACH